jgi:hypothetical protein
VAHQLNGRKDMTLSRVAGTQSIRSLKGHDCSVDLLLPHLAGCKCVQGVELRIEQSASLFEM